MLLRLRRTWRDGTRAIRFEPSEFLEKLASMIPKPRINLLIYHGVFGPHARCRKDAVRRAHEGAHWPGSSPGTNEATDLRATALASGTTSYHSPMAPASTQPTAAPVGGTEPRAPATARPPPPVPRNWAKRYAWADLLERTFAIDILACPECGGRLPSIRPSAYSG